MKYQAVKSAPARTRTLNLLIKSQLLCQLSYRGARFGNRAADYSSGCGLVQGCAPKLRPSPSHVPNGRVSAQRVSSSEERLFSVEAKPYRFRASIATTKECGLGHPLIQRTHHPMKTTTSQHNSDENNTTKREIVRQKSEPRWKSHGPNSSA